MEKTWVVAIIEIATDAIVDEIDCKTTSQHQAERVERGVNINLNHGRFYTSIEERQKGRCDGIR